MFPQSVEFQTVQPIRYLHICSHTWTHVVTFTDVSGKKFREQ